MTFRRQSNRQSIQQPGHLHPESLISSAVDSTADHNVLLPGLAPSNDTASDPGETVLLKGEGGSFRNAPVQRGPFEGIYITWSQIAVVLVLLSGLILRCYNLEQHIYWHDEVFSSLRVSGYTVDDVKRQTVARQFGAAELKKYQRPGGGKTLHDVLLGLTEEPHQLPLYFLIARLWCDLFGSSVQVMRSLSVLFSLLILPSVYWLCRQLFDIPLAAWLAVILMAVSPFHLVYAQEARSYSLWMLITVLSSAALLWARRVTLVRASLPAADNKVIENQVGSTTSSHGLLQNASQNGYRGAWGLYSITVAIGMYAHLFFAFVLLAHVIYMLVLEIRRAETYVPMKGHSHKDQDIASQDAVESKEATSARFCIRPGFHISRILLCCSIAWLVGLLCYLPWLQVILQDHGKMRASTSWMSVGQAPLHRFENAVQEFTRLFLDINYAFPYGQAGWQKYLLMLPNFVLVGFVLYAIYYTARRNKEHTGLFIVVLILCGFAPLAIMDLWWGGQRSSVMRYLSSCWIGAEIAVAYLIASQVNIAPQRKGQTGRRLLWQSICCMLIAAGLLSGMVHAHSQMWWNSSLNNDNLEHAAILNARPQPLVITEIGEVIQITCLSYSLQPKVLFRVVYGPPLNVLPEASQQTFLYRPSDKLRHWFENEKDYQVVPVDHPVDPTTGHLLWSIKRRLKRVRSKT